jgi:peptidoglycan/xylan/chitin deacetylase (PgdA/CDA1 family)
MDSDDSDIKDAEQLVAHVLEKRPQPGEILLFHEDYAQTVVALPPILERIASLGMTFVRVRDLRGSR